MIDGIHQFRVNLCHPGPVIWGQFALTNRSQGLEATVRYVLRLEIQFVVRVKLLKPIHNGCD